MEFRITTHRASIALTVPVVLALAFLVAGVPSARAQTRDRTALAGLDGVGIIVEKVADAAGYYGLTRTALLIDAEMALGQAGVPVLPMTEYLDAPSAPYLHIDLDVAPTGTSGQFAYTVDVQLRQDVLSAIAPDTELYDATTWRVGQDLRIVDAEGIRGVRAQVRALVAEFIADYVAANAP